MRSLGSPGRRCEDNTRIRMDLREIGINTKDWFDFAQNRVYWKVIANADCTTGFHRP